MIISVKLCTSLCEWTSRPMRLEELVRSLYKKGHYDRLVRGLITASNEDVCLVMHHVMLALRKYCYDDTITINGHRSDVFIPLYENVLGAQLTDKQMTQAKLWCRHPNIESAVSIITSMVMELPRAQIIARAIASTVTRNLAHANTWKRD